MSSASVRLSATRGRSSRRESKPHHRKRRTNMRSLIVTGLLLLASQAATAQYTGFPADVQPGTRARVGFPEPARQDASPDHRQLLRGAVQSVDGGVLRLLVPGTDGELEIPRASVRRLDGSRGVSGGASMGPSA